VEKMNGCYNRKALANYNIVQQGWIAKGMTRIAHMVKISDPMSKDCQYSKLTDDMKCEGCKWKIKTGQN